MDPVHGACGARKPGGVLIQTPGASGGPTMVVPALRRSLARSARMPAAACWPTSIPLASAGPSGTAARDEAYSASMSADLDGYRARRTSRPARAAAASAEAGVVTVGRTV